MAKRQIETENIPNNLLQQIALANTKSEAALAIANTANLQGVRLGAWNASTNTPTLTPDASAVVPGGFYDVVVAGTQAITGTSRLFVAGERIAKIEEHWYAIPNGVSEGAITPEKTTFLSISNNPEYLGGFVDEDDNALLLFHIDGTLEGLFRLKDNQVLEKHIEAQIIKRLPEYLLNDFIQNNCSFIDDDDNILLEFTKEGKVKAFFDFSLEKIKKEYLETSIQQVLPTLDISDFLDYSLVYLDEEDTVLFGILKNGSLVGNISLPHNTISVGMLDIQVQQALLSESNIRKLNYNESIISPVNDYNYTEIDFPIITSKNGITFEKMPQLNTNGISGTVPVDVEIVNTPNFIQKGSQFCGFFSGVVPEKLFRNMGWFLNTATQLPQSPQVGDFWICVFWYLDPKQKTIGNITFNEWDVLYYDSTGFKIQQTLKASTNIKEGDFWVSDSQSAFWDKQLKINERLVYLGLKTGGGYNIPVFTIAKDSDFSFMGEINPNTFINDSSLESSYYIANQDGIFNGMGLKYGDLLIRKNNSWGVFQSKLQTIKSNTYASIACNKTSSLSIRTALKASDYYLSLKANVTVNKKESSEDLVLYSDSMFGSNVGSSIAQLFLSRTVSIESYGGGSSNNILTKVKENLLLKLHTNKTHVFWHGQNNNTDIKQIQMVTLQMIELACSLNNKYVVWSMLGQIGCYFNNFRLVFGNHEEAFFSPDISRFVKLENWYDTVLKEKHFNVRKEALIACNGRNRPHLQFPSKSEYEVANQYGVPALSFFFDYTSVSWNPSDLIFIGYHSNIGLPNGGANNNYYLRSGNGNIGSVIVNVNGTWIEYTHDVTHMSKEGANAIAERFKLFVINNKL